MSYSVMELKMQNIKDAHSIFLKNPKNLYAKNMYLD